MTSNKLEYDSSLGGPVVLESHVQTYRYAASSVQEIKRLLNEVRHPSSTKLVFQKLPKHMRRRAMSHHPKRLPRKYRGIHRSQMAKAGKPQQTKRPSRKFRRKPSNLLREYIRRQRRHIWMETHIWHAKRFHMTTRWGYRLPFASCDKTFRACYRATTQHCLLQDISFYACLQLEGTLAEISEGFSKLSSVNCGLSVAAKTYVSGRREGSIELFRAGKYPEGALGRVSFIWKPLESSQSEQNADMQRILWLWVHPSGYQPLLEEIIKVFALISMKSIKVPLEGEGKIEHENVDQKDDEIEDKGNSEDSSSSKKKDSNTKLKKKCSAKQQRRLQFMTKTFAYERIKRYTNDTNTLRLSELKDTLNRFRLTGPLAQSVLAHAFKVKPLNLTEEPENWFRQQLEANLDYQKYHQTQADYWQQCAANLSSPTELMSNIIIALNIEDPRIHRPDKRTKAIPKYDPNNTAQIQKLMIESPTTLPHSLIWQSDVRDCICEQMVTTQAYCELREKHVVVPGAACAFERQLQPLPVLLIQRPGSQRSDYKRLGYGCGWDVIAPAGYGMSIWLALIMWGAKPGGLREFASIARESGVDEFSPDTVGGQQQLTDRYIELRDKYFRLPPNKRCNYQKFAIISPFRVPLKELVRDWHAKTTAANTTTTSATSSFFVLRDRKILQQLELCIKQRRLNLPKEISPNCLIQMQFIMKSRGNLGDFALICLPTRNDFKRNLKLIKRENREPIYTEPLQSDPNEQQRKKLRIEHKKLLKRLRSRRVREKRKQQQTSTQRVHIRPAGTSHLVDAQFKRMCELWLSENKVKTLNSIREQCSRQVFGYITNSNFSYTEATVGGVGYVTIEGLRQLLNVCSAAHIKRPMCLVRSTNSRHYRFASFKLNMYN